jgi:hypothetical protein
LLCRPVPSRRGDGGLVTLEWLLVVSAIAGIAAGSYLAVERALETEILRPAGPAARLVAADVAAAVVVNDAVDLAVAGFDPETWDDSAFRARCEGIAGDFSDVVVMARWLWESAWTPHWLDGTDADGNDLPSGSDPNPARCVLTPRDLSAGP